ncbi:TPA: hypothetical protein WMC85_001714 [Neisseria gonorrhoeae]
MDQNPRQGAFRLGLTQPGPTLSDGIRAGTGTRPPDSNRDDALPPVRGRMAASAPSAPFHFTPPFRNPPDPTCGMKRLSRREVFY